MKSALADWRTPLCALLLALPWLWPLTPGPHAGTAPYLVAATCAGLLLLLWPRSLAQGVRALAGGWLLAASLSALIALLQYFNWESALYPVVNQAKTGQAFGNLRQPNQLATHLLLGLLALGWWQQNKRWPWAVTAAWGALLLAALAATASRTGLLGLLALAAVGLWWAVRARAWRPALLAAGGALAFYALAAVALPWALQALDGSSGRDLISRLQTAESTCGSRLILWHNVLALIRFKPLTGWGWGNLDWAHYMHLYEGARFCHILDNAHNLPLHLAVELGLPVAALACAAMLWALIRLRPWAEAQPTRQLALGVLLAIGLHSLVEYPLWYGPFQMACAGAAWLLWSTRTAAAHAARPPRLRLRAALGVAVLCVSSYAAWDYWRVSQLYLLPEQRTSWWRANPLAAAQHSRLFAGTVRFARYTLQTPTEANAHAMVREGLHTLHYSPEPRVIRRVIESATLAGQTDLAARHLRRFKAAFPQQARAWQAERASAAQAAPARAPKSASADASEP